MRIFVWILTKEKIEVEQGYEFERPESSVFHVTCIEKITIRVTIRNESYKLGLGKSGLKVTLVDALKDGFKKCQG